MRLSVNIVLFLFALYLCILSRVWVRPFSKLVDKECADSQTNTFFKSYGTRINKFTFMFALICALAWFVAVLIEIIFFLATRTDEKVYRAKRKEQYAEAINLQVKEEQNENGQTNAINNFNSMPKPTMESGSNTNINLPSIPSNKIKE